mgnify:CR=1 FL=1
MGFFGRLKTGWALSMDSLQVLRREPSLSVFPLIAALSGAIFMGLILGGAVFVTGSDPGPALYGALFLVYLGTAFISSFFTAALVYNAREVFEGRDPTLNDGMAAAWRNKRTLFVWALISAIVGTLLRAIESADNPIADIASIIFSVAWGILTYFIIPVIVFENVGVRDMFSRSGSTFKETWGETAGAGFGVGIITVLFTLVGLAIAAVVFLTLGSTAVGAVGAIAFAVLVVLLAFLLGSTLGSVAKTALYVYATEGRRPDGFENVDFSNARS